MFISILFFIYFLLVASLVNLGHLLTFAYIFISTLLALRDHNHSLNAVFVYLQHMFYSDFQQFNEMTINS